LNETDSIQVRIVGPKLGLAKGMLLKQQGISRIQLPESMIKAPCSETCNANYAAVIVKNEFPSALNIQIGRFLDPDAKDARQSWKDEAKKPLSKMYRRMLVGYGVKHADVDVYARSAKDHAKLKHGESRQNETITMCQLFSIDILQIVTQCIGIFSSFKRGN
jgi:hypothetical protein